MVSDRKMTYSSRDKLLADRMNRSEERGNQEMLRQKKKEEEMSSSTFIMHNERETKIDLTEAGFKPPILPQPLTSSHHKRNVYTVFYHPFCEKAVSDPCGFLRLYFLAVTPCCCA